MQYNQKRMLRFITVSIALFVFIMMIGGNVLAVDPPKITIAPTWRPAVTLDSVDLLTPNVFDVGDDFRYVDAEIYITTSVEFWAVQLTCSIAPPVVAPLPLTSYDSAATDGDPNNMVEPVIWGPRWGTLGNEFTQVTDAYNPVAGTRTITATRLGNLNPMGNNGYNDTFLLATLRYRAKDIAVSAASPLNCTSAFLNRNGVAVLAATYVAPTPLSILTGYTISGTVTYQGRATHAGINVTCDGPDADTLPDFSVVTTATGAFSNTTLRNQGFFDCSFYGNISDPAAGYQPDKYLAAYTNVYVSGQSYNFLPIILVGGNLSKNDDSTDTLPGTMDEVIDGSDISIITAPANWGKLTPAGDVNGDGKTDRADLAITAANFQRFERVDARHVIYSLPRDFDFWQNDRIWMGASWAGAVTQLVASPPANARDNWATLSPDGKKLVFVRDPGNDNPVLFTASITNGVVGAPVRLTPPGAWYAAFAPSWSPDGTRIAFVCSWWDDGVADVGDGNHYSSGYLADMGSLCVIDANGRNAQVLPFQQRVTSRIYPPAWLSNTELVFGGSWTIPVTDESNQVCPNTLCYYNIQTSEARIFDADIVVSATQIADMPVISNGVLFYRFYDSVANTHVIRWAQLINGGVDPFENRAGAVAPYHMVLDYDTHPAVGTNFAPISTDVDYFNVGQNTWNIIYYQSGGYNIDKSWWNSGDLSGPTPLEWSPSYENWVDDMVGNPPPLNTPLIPDDPNDSSQLYAHRSTFDWVP